MATASKTFTFTVNASPSPGGPTWWQNLAVGSWTTVAGAVGTRIIDKTPSPTPADASHPGGNPYTIGGAWNGAVVDQVGRKYIMCANGGDGDYCGNEVYQLDLGAESPSWALIGNPSPNSAINGTWNLVQPYYSDGGMKSDHTSWSQFFYNNKVWLVTQNSSWVTNGYSSLWSWDRARGLAGGTGGSLNGVEDSVKPWTFYGYHAGSYLFTTGAYDSVRNKYWRMHQNGPAQGFFSYDPTTPAVISTYTASNPTGFSPQKTGASAIAEDLYSWIIVDSYLDAQQRLMIIDVTNPTATPVVVTTTPTLTWETSTPGRFGAGTFEGSSLVYHNGALYYANPPFMGGVVRKLVVPTTGTGTSKRPDPNGAWVWSTLAANGTPPTAYPWTGVTVSNASHGSYTKFNVIKDMGNGQAALIVNDHPQLPTYVYKLG